MQDPALPESIADVPLAIISTKKMLGLNNNPVYYFKFIKVQTMLIKPSPSYSSNKPNSVILNYIKKREKVS